jgi:para-aminobenzoate synthetase component 1
MNSLGKKRIPFLFFLDFEMKNPRIYPLDSIPAGIQYYFNGHTNSKKTDSEYRPFILEKFPMCFQEYSQGFEKVINEIKKGNSFLLNLSYPTKIITDLTFDEIYNRSTAPYKLLYLDEWVVFSPEPFVKIKNGQIFSFPMKGTIDAAIPNAAQKILSDYKETAEHNTIVDLIRNDLSRVAKNVQVKKYRYLDKIHTNEKDILQVSSEIAGDLPSDFHNKLGDLFNLLLPAGSISGAPKKKTIEIIQEVEGQERGYYTGIAGIYDGETVDSTVLIRFIEEKEDGKYFRSGGGITHLSTVQKEYQELIDKVYVPIRRNHQDREWKSQTYRIPQ